MSSSTKAGIIVACIVIVGGALFVLTRDNSTTTSNQSNSSVARTSTSAQEASSTESPASSSDKPITKEQVALHASENDCWTIIEGEVYDITSYIPRHPGGDNIQSACGTDATSFFNGEKAGRSGDTNKHGGAARSALSSLRIGTLAQ